MCNLEHVYWAVQFVSLLCTCAEITICNSFFWFSFRKPERQHARLLQGHIGLDQAIFPEGTPGLALDTLARAPLWSLGLNYRHGTGHGVGAALNVHEGPHSISTRYGCNSSHKCGLIV